jgi:DNA-binding HxlR family transcriptional regulator
MSRLKDTTYHCAIEVTLGLVAGKWKALILCHLALATSRFSALKRTFPGITRKMLTQQLREQEEDGERRTTERVQLRVSRVASAAGCHLHSMGYSFREAARDAYPPGQPKIAISTAQQIA